MYNSNYYGVIDPTRNGYLMHYGRKGMKWYQHIFSKEKSFIQKISSRKNTKYDTSKLKKTSSSSTNGSSSSSSSSRKTVKSMTNEELKVATERINLENAYKQAKNNSKSTSKSSTENTSEQSKSDYSSKAMQTKPLSQMTNSEIQAYITRKNLETQYSNLNPKKITTGQKIANEMKGAAVNATKDLAKAGALALGAYAGNKVIEYANKVNAENGKSSINKTFVYKDGKISFKDKKTSTTFAQSAAKYFNGKSASEVTNEEIQSFINRAQKEHAAEKIMNGIWSDDKQK